MKRSEYLWYEDSGIAICNIYYKDLVFSGEAICHPDDKEFMSRISGCEIAEMRAIIKYLQHIKNNELRPSIQALTDYYNTMIQSAKFNQKSYENKMLRRRIQLLKDDLVATQENIVQIKKKLRDYLAKKEKMHEVIRNIRKK